MKGYEKLDDVLARAFQQASQGKGKERHANDLPFHEQPMQQIANQVGRGFLLGQAIKKLVESQGLPPEKAVAEQLGAICYIAGSIIHLEASNDNQPQPEVRFEPIIKNATVEYLDENYQLIDADVGIEIPDNWIRVPEGAEDFRSNRKFYKENGVKFFSFTGEWIFSEQTGKSSILWQRNNLNQSVGN